MTEEDFRKLYQRYAPMVYAKCRLILGNEQDAAECVQEVFFKVQQAYSSFAKSPSAVAWLYRVATNLCLNTLRTRKRKWPQGDVEPQDLASSSNPEKSAMSSQFLKQILFKLKDSDREIFVYTHIDQMTQEEICEVSGQSRSTVARAQVRIRALMDEVKLGSQ